MCKLFFWCGRWDLNPYGLPYAPQTYASAYSAMAAILSFATGIIIIKSRAIVNINFITPHFLTQKSCDLLFKIPVCGGSAVSYKEKAEFFAPRQV